MTGGRRATIRRAAGLALPALAAFLAAGPAPAEDRGKDVSAVLAERGTVSCVPAIRHFCRNIHISCSGLSKIRTRPFELHVSGKTGTLVFSSPMQEDDRKGTPDRGPVRFARGYALLRLGTDGGYVKLEADGRYSHRIYSHGTALMSHGTCS